MKRMRSAPYGEEFDDDGDVGEKLSFKDWPRRSQDPDRSLSSSSHRRPSYSKAEGSRKVLSSYDRSLDDDWEPSRHVRRRYDHEAEGFDWRKGYDRYRDGRDGGDRLMQISSPRGSYGVDHRMHRSESFSGLRREFPKGFRSERDRSRREGNGSSSWWRSRSSKELSAEEVRKSPSIESDSVGRRSHAASPEDHRGKVRSRDSSSGVQSKRLESKTLKTPKLSRESGSSSEMEEGELQPDPEPETVAEPSVDSKATEKMAPESCKDSNLEDIDLPKNVLEMAEILPVVKKSGFDGNSPTDVKEESCKDTDPQCISPPEENSKRKEIIADENKLDDDGNNTLYSVAEGSLSEPTLDHGDTTEEVRNEQSEPTLDHGDTSEEVRNEQSDALEELHENDKITETIMDQRNTTDAVGNEQCAVKELDGSCKEGEGKAKAGNGDGEVEANVFVEESNAIKELDESSNEREGKTLDQNVDNEMEDKYCGEKCDASKELDEGRREGLQNINEHNEMDGEFCGEDEEVCKQNSLCAPLQGGKMEGNDEDKEVKGVTETTSDIPQVENLVENEEEAQYDGTKVEIEQNHDMDTGIEQNHDMDTGIEQNQVMTAEVELQQKHDTGIEQNQVVTAEIELQQKHDTGIEQNQVMTAETELQQKHDTGIEQNQVMTAEIEQQLKRDTGIEHEVEQEERREIDLETEPEGALSSFDQDKDFACETKHEVVTLTLMKDQTKENYKDKGKGLAISFSAKGNSMEEDDVMEGPSGRGFELDFRLETSQPEKACSSGIIPWRDEHEKLKIEPLDLSLALPGGSSDHSSKHLKPKPETSSCARSIQSLPSSFRTNSDGLTTSISLASSQLFVHNPSCSLTQNSMDNYEHSVGSHPIFQRTDQVSSSAIWQAQTTDDSKKKGSIPHFQRALLNGNSSHNSLHSMEGYHQSKSNGLMQQSGFPRQMSPSNSHGSRDSRSQQTKDKRLLTRERSSSSLCRTEQRDGEQLILNGSGVTEKVVSKIVTEPLHLNGRMLQEMTVHSVEYLRKTISEMLTGSDKSRQLHEFQEALQRRTDITMDALMNCPRVLLEILVSIKTGLPDFIQVNNISSSDLVEIFLNLRCHNLACRSSLPVDDCECKFCIEKPGFCSACTCLVCSKFDNALNTCSWVGCDVCLHWCHTDCGLRDSYIRNGCSASGEGTTEMQFHCVACGHPSEMFGFVKEVFKTCAKDWNAETLAKELQYVRRIFSASNDVRGKRLHNLAAEMLLNLEKNTNHCEVVSRILAFLSDSASYLSSITPLFMHKESSRNEAGQSTDMSSLKKEWLSFSSEKSSLLKNTGAVSSTGYDQLGRKSKEIELQMSLEKKPVVDELDSVVKFKLAEAKLYQERADDARREAESLKHIAMAKNSKIDEDYANRIEKLQVGEAEERRKRKLDELQAIERAHREYFNMKMRMEADIKDLLLKMEATRRNLNP